MAVWSRLTPEIFVWEREWERIVLAGAQARFALPGSASTGLGGCGYPRAVSNLALQSLVAAFASGKNLVDEPAARSAVTEVVAPRSRRQRPRTTGRFPRSCPGRRSGAGFRGR
jgi:hypothetical protein